MKASLLSCADNERHLMLLYANILMDFCIAWTLGVCVTAINGCPRPLGKRLAWPQD